ncbi:MAG TPA: hypothetical protein PLQ40_01975 [Ferruginibacter sp.]|nr:hypothetical protein [Ferruginibacter sp.]HNJ27689.1 hypothetical protein [Ferruginibacter sp.]
MNNTMFTEEQIKQMVSMNDSLQAQLADLNYILKEREEELAMLRAELGEATALRSNLDGKQAEIESLQDKLELRQLQAVGAEERELELKQELNEAGRMNPKYEELARAYAYLQSQHEDLKLRLAEMTLRNEELNQFARKAGELESRLEMLTLERDDLRNRLADQETQKHLKEYNI